MSEISDKLAQSRVEHMAYRSALQYQKREMAFAAMQRALNLRLEADAADPDHLDPAWGVNEISFPHAALCAFYNDQLSRA